MWLIVALQIVEVLTHVPPDRTQSENMFHLNLTKLLSLTSSFQDIRELEEQVKWYYKETSTQIQNIEHSTKQLNWFFKTLTVCVCVCVCWEMFPESWLDTG